MPTYAQWAHDQFGFVRPIIRRPTQQRSRPWTDAERAHLRHLWQIHGTSDSVARVMNRHRDDVRYAIDKLGIRSFSIGRDSYYLTTIPVGYYAALER